MLNMFGAKGNDYGHSCGDEYCPICVMEEANKLAVAIQNFRWRKKLRFLEKQAGDEPGAEAAERFQCAKACARCHKCAKPISGVPCTTCSRL